MTEKFFAWYSCLCEGQTSPPLLVTSSTRSLFYRLFRKHCTLPITLFIYRKCPTENSGNGSSDTLNLKIFWGTMSPEPPSLECFRSSNFSFRSYTFKISRHARDYHNWHPTRISKHNSPFPISPEFPSFFLSFPVPRKNLMGAIPLYKPYRCVPPYRVGFCAIFDLKTGIDFPHFGLELV